MSERPDRIRVDVDPARRALDQVINRLDVLERSRAVIDDEATDTRGDQP